MRPLGKVETGCGESLYVILILTLRFEGSELEKVYSVAFRYRSLKVFQSGHRFLENLFQCNYAQIFSEITHTLHSDHLQTPHKTNFQEEA